MNLPNDFVAAPDLLAGRVILVTGAGDGIGRAAARTFAAHGASVIGVGRTIAKLETLYDEIKAAGHPEPVIQGVDLSGVTRADCQQLAEAIGTQFGRLDGVLHNASILGPRLPLAQYDADAWRRVMTVNLDSNFLLTQALLPWLEDGIDPMVLFTSSGAGLRPRAYWGAYAISKAGIEALMKVFADEHENLTRIRFASLNPGGTRTAMRAAAMPGENPGTLPTPMDLMPLYLWLFGAATREQCHGRTFDAREALGLG